MNEIENKKDPLSGELFIPKRISQRFACRANQIRFNNLLAKQKRIKKAIYDKPLDKNRTILKTILGNKSVIIKSKDFLLGMGYDFRLSLYNVPVSDEKGTTATGIYEFLIIPLENNNYEIQKI